jgi:hypothetical protein
MPEFFYVNTILNKRSYRLILHAFISNLHTY